MTGKICIVRTETAGVFFGEVVSYSHCVIRMKNVRKLWKWDGACAVEQLALDGVQNPENCMFTVTVPEMVIAKPIQIIEASTRAIESIEGGERVEKMRDKVSIWVRMNGSGSGAGDEPHSHSNPQIIEFNNHCVVCIDGINTAITSIHNQTAKGYIIMDDLTTADCFVVKTEDGLFAHGRTLREANDALEEKINYKTSIPERIERFLDNFNIYDTYSGKVLYEWHNKLTGSCKTGRDQFVRTHNIDLNKKYSIEDFVKLTKGSYRHKIIMDMFKLMNMIQ